MVMLFVFDYLLIWLRPTRFIFSFLFASDSIDRTKVATGLATGACNSVTLHTVQACLCMNIDSTTVTFQHLCFLASRLVYRETACWDTQYDKYSTA